MFNTYQDGQDIVVVDLDDSLFHFSESFYNQVNLKLGQPDVWHPMPTQYNLATHYPNMNVLEELLDFEEVGGMDHLYPCLEMKEEVLRHWDQGTFVILLTARSWMREPISRTLYSLQKHGVKFNALDICRLDVCKSEHIKQYPKRPKKLYEDNPKHIVNCAPFVDEVVIVDRPWNRHLNGTRVYHGGKE